MRKSIFIGFDPFEAAAFAVARNSARRNLTQQIPIAGLVLAELQRGRLYTRPTHVVINGEWRPQLVDELSKRADYDGRISTEHAIARFLVPHIAPSGWALFMDGDVLVRGNLARIFEGLEIAKAVYCVKHQHDPINKLKKAGHVQTRYARKNWSSVMIWNVGHPANRRLTIESINTLPGRDLHRFCWLRDDEIGELDQKWNWLAGHSDPAIDPAIVHFTDGAPNIPGYETAPYADEWRRELALWAAAQLQPTRAAVYA